MDRLRIEGRRAKLLVAVYCLLAGLTVALVLGRVAEVYNMPAAVTFDLPRHAELLAKEALEHQRDTLDGAPAEQRATSAGRAKSRLSGLVFMIEKHLPDQAGAPGILEQLHRLQRLLDDPSPPPALIRTLGSDARLVAGDIQALTQEVVTLHTRMVRAYALWTGALSVAVGLAGMVLLLLLIALRQKNRELRNLATRDTLTGLPNRRDAQDQGAMFGSLARRNGLPLAVAVLDLDRFKTINDSHGHPVGDAVLQWVASRLTSLKRRSDVVARMGGEEFCLILPETDLDGARTVCERVRAALAAEPMIHDGTAIAVTASIGAAMGCGDEADFAALYRKADRALYAAKAAGRDQVRLAG